MVSDIRMFKVLRCATLLGLTMATKRIIMKATRPAWTGDRLRKLRKRLRLSQEEMAQRLGYDRAGTISEFENGHREIPQRTALLLDTLEQQSPAEAAGE